MAKQYYRGHEQWKKEHPLREGTPCPRCGNPMYKQQKLDVGHVVDAALGGAYGPRRYEHTSCNRSAGAQLGQRIKRANKPAPQHDQENHSETW